MSGAAPAARTAPTPGVERDPKGFRKLFAASTISNLGDGIGLIAYPWLASAITRSPFLIALVAVAQRLPWLLFSLPAGVLTDRHDRKRLLIGTDVVRAALTAGVAVAVLARSGSLRSPDELTVVASVPGDAVLYVVLLIATMLLGFAEVLHDNSAETFIPAVVDRDELERANGRLWSAEQVANAFAGPPVAALLLSVGFVLPFVIDAASFAAAAVLVSLIHVPSRTAPDEPGGAPSGWRTELAEGVRWLWRHDLLRPMAIVLGAMNALAMMTMSVLVLFAQEVLDTSPTQFALLSVGAAVGGVLGGWTASTIVARLGPGRTLGLTLVGGGLSSAGIGVSSHWLAVSALLSAFGLLGVLWNVITVSLRQTIIPDRLLGRVNSVYRFFAWGMMPVGAVAGGVIVTVGEATVSRDLALRIPWLVAGVAHLVLFAVAAPKLTSDRIEAARATADAGSSPHS